MYKIVANWKMYLSIAESRNLAAELLAWWSEKPCLGAQFVVCPGHLALLDVLQQIKGAQLILGAQDVSLSSDLGAFTGQVAGQHLVELGCEQVIIGHSEMRRFYQETDAMVRQKLLVAQKHGLHAIVCVGETAEERNSGQAQSLVAGQLQTIFADVDIKVGEFTIAYEPRWAISSVAGAKAVQPQDASNMHQVIKHSLREFYSEEEISSVSVLYGGSVNAENIIQFLQAKDVGGALIGSASTKPESLKQIVKLIQENFC